MMIHVRWDFQNDGYICDTCGLVKVVLERAS